MNKCFGFSAIHNSSELIDVQKFTYLRSYLTDAALKSVSGLKLTNENYGKALTILKECYENKQAIVSTHTENLRVVSSDANKPVYGNSSMKLNQT